MAYPRFQMSRNFKYVLDESGSYNVNDGTTDWHEIDTGLRLTIAANEADVIMFTISSGWSDENRYGYLDVATIVSGTEFNWVGGDGTSSTNGITGWYSPNYEVPCSGVAYYQVDFADVVGGTVTFSLQGRVGTTGTKTLSASTTDPLFFAAHNLGPEDQT